MIKDLLSFMCIMAVFVVAYGVTTEATMNKTSKLDFNLFRQIIRKSYWPIFGTIDVLDDFSKVSFECDDESDDCSEIVGFIYTYVLLMIYVLVANVLLINLLIAMFRY